MKLSSKQANILAQEIVNQLKQKKVQRVPDTIKIQLKRFIEKRDALRSKVIEAEAAVEQHDKILKTITGNATDIQPYNPISRMIEKLEEKQIPKVYEIENEIILKSLFNTEEDMEKFVKAIVDKHSKKLQNKVLAN